MTIFQLKARLRSLLLLIISANNFDDIIQDNNRLVIDYNKLNDCSDNMKQSYEKSGHREIYEIYSKLLGKDLTVDAKDILTRYDLNLCNIFFQKYYKTLAQ